MINMLISMTSNPLIILLFLLSAVNPSQPTDFWLIGTCPVPWDVSLQAKMRGEAKRVPAARQSTAAAAGAGERSWQRVCTTQVEMGPTRWSASSDVPKAAGELVFYLTFSW